MSERGGSDIERLWIFKWRHRQSIRSRSSNPSFIFSLIVGRIRLFPTLISKIKWYGSELPWTFHENFGLLEITISWAKWGASGSAKRWANLVRDDLTPGWTVNVDACATHLSTIENIWDEKIESKSPSPDSDSNCDWLDKWECLAESSSTIPSECTPQRGDPFKRSKVISTAHWHNFERIPRNWTILGRPRVPTRRHAYTNYRK